MSLSNDRASTKLGIKTNDVLVAGFQIGTNCLLCLELEVVAVELSGRNERGAITTVFGAIPRPGASVLPDISELCNRCGTVFQNASNRID